MIFRFIVFIAVIFLFSCSQNSSINNDFFEIKKLEYFRNSDIDLWKKFDQPQNFDLIVASIGKTKKSPLLSLLENHLPLVNSDTALCGIIFSIGQIATPTGINTLLNFPIKTQTAKVQNCILNSLALNPSKDILEYYASLLTVSDLKPAILSASGIIAKQSIEISAIKHSVLDSVSKSNPSVALSYFMSYAATSGDLPDLLEMVNLSRDDSRKFLLKSILNLYGKRKSYITSKVLDDSLMNVHLYSAITHILTAKSQWADKYYALQLVPIVADSTLTNEVQRLCNSKDIHVKLTALHTFAETGAELALSVLLRSFEQENHWFVKGEIIKILAEFFPNKAYPFIMQNLDKGNRTFKSQLLEALALLNNRLAHRTLRQFLNVDDPLLVNTAFKQLSDLRLIREADLDQLLLSDNFSTVASVLNFKKQKRKKTDIITLKSLYNKFKYPSEFEVQFEVIEALKEHQSTFDDSTYQYLIANASHYVVQEKLKEVFNSDVNPILRNLQPYFQLPQHLHPDSIQYFTIYPEYEVKTDKGSIQIRLYSDIAPLTVFNFSKLVEMNFYNGLAFHRVVPDFVIQGGDPLGDGWGGPNYFIPSEHSSLPFLRGSLGIATSGFDTGSSQFFICQSDQPHLNGKYTLFGRVTSGLEVVDSILPGDEIISIKPIN